MHLEINYKPGTAFVVDSCIFGKLIHWSCLGLGDWWDRGSISGRGRYFSFKSVQFGSGVFVAVLVGVNGRLPGAKRPELEADRPQPSSVDVKNALTSTSTPPYVVTEWP
jgi:hypothetical protein